MIGSLPYDGEQWAEKNESLNFCKTKKNPISSQITNLSKGRKMLKDTAEIPSYKILE